MAIDQTKPTKSDLYLQNQKLAEQKLLASETRFTESQKLARIGSWEYDTVENSIWWSDELYHIFGFDPKTTVLSYEKFINSIHPDDRDALEKLIGKRESYRSDYRIVLPDGQIKYIHEEVVLVKDKKGEITKMKGTAQDVTERVSTTKSLQKNEKRFSVIFEKAPFAAALSRLADGVIEIVNEEFENILGYTRTEVIGRTSLELGIFPDLDTRTRSGELFQSQGFARNLEMKLRTKSSETRIFLVNTDPVEIWDEKFVLTTAKDITERKLAEGALHESEERYRLLTENAQDMIYRMSLPDGRYEYVSPAAQDIFGYPVQAFYDTPILIKESIHPNWQNYFDEQWRNLIAGQMPPSYEYQIINKSGETRWLNQRNVLIQDIDGNPVAIEGIVTDISARKQAEQVLLESEKRFQYAMEATKDGLYDWNLVTNQIYYSPGWKRILGYEDDELLNDFSIWETLTEPEDINRSWEMQQQLINKERERFELEFKMKHKDGHWVDILSRANATFDENGKATRIIGTHVDITERKRAEETQRLTDARLSVIFNNTTDLQLLMAVESESVIRVAAVNKAFIDASNLIGLEISEKNLIGKSLEELFSIMGFSQELFDYTLANYHTALKTSEPVKYLETIPFELGVYHAEITLIPVLDQGSKIVYILYNSHNISELRETADKLQKLNIELEERVDERTKNLQILVEAMTGREVRMAGLKKVIKKLRAQLQDAGLEPVADDPLLGGEIFLDDE